MGMINPKTRYKNLFIEDIPIMITQDNKILCIPSTDEVKHIGVTGMTGCQPAGSNVLMADGSWKNIKNIKVGDLIISPQKDGSNIFSKVKSITKWFSDENYEIKEQNRRKRTLYKCSHNHLIPFYYRSLLRINGKRESKNAIWKIKHETASNFNKYSKHANTHIRAGFSSFLIEEFNNQKNCEIEPYTLGVFLGDGCSFYKVNNQGDKKRKSENLSITSMNEEIIQEVSKFYPVMKIQMKKNNRAKQYMFSLKGELHKQLEKYGLKGKKSGAKFIPKGALLSNSEYRKKLLAGLIDTDGNLSRGYCYSICTTSEQLSKDIEFLIYSLGGRCSIKKYKASIKSLNFIGKRYIISLYLHKMELPLKVKYKIRNKKTFYISSNRVAISTKKSNSCIVYGFEIDSPSKWYITDNWMITHNTCKSIFLNSLLSWDYWHIGRKCINLNDFQKETFEWGLPTESFIEILNKINTSPCPTPLVYVFPSTRTLQLEDKDKRFPLLKITLPIEEVIKNVENYYSLDKSKVYLGNLMDKLIDCNSIGEIRSIFDEDIPKKHIFMKYKLMNIFESLFNNNMLNVSVPEAPAFLEYSDKSGRRYYNLSIQTLLRAGFVPSIQTSDLRNQEYFSAYMSFIVESIYRNQYEDSYFKNQTLSLFVDEIDKLWPGHNGNLVKTSLNLIGTNGRSARIGLRWSTQHYEQVPDQIRGNTKYLFVSRKSDAKEVNEIRRDFDIPKSLDKDILNLKIDRERGIFEMIALTTEKFVLYDLATGKISYSSEAHKGYLIPSPARHHRPNVPI